MPFWVYFYSLCSVLGSCHSVFVHLSSKVLLLCACMVLLGDTLWWKNMQTFLLSLFHSVMLQNTQTIFQREQYNHPCHPHGSATSSVCPRAAASSALAQCPIPTLISAVTLARVTPAMKTLIYYADIHKQISSEAKDLCTHHFVFSNEISCSLLATYCDLNAFVCSVTVLVEI